MPEQYRNGWTEWSKHVITELERQDGIQEMLRADINTLKIEIAQIKTKIAVYSAVGGILGSIGIIMLKRFLGLL